MTTPEGKIKAAIKKVLRRPGLYYHMPVQNGMGAPSLDFIVCCNGRYLAIEAKAPGKKPTPRQEQTMLDIRKGGGYVFTVSCQDELDVVEAYINLLL